MDSTTDDIISIPLPEKRRRFSFAKCIICQVDKPDVLRKAKASSIAVFVRSLQLRKDEVYDRLSEEISNCVTVKWCGIHHATLLILACVQPDFHPPESGSANQCTKSCSRDR